MLKLLFRGKKEWTSLFVFVAHALSEGNYGLAVAAFWKSFEEEFKKCPKSLNKILLDAGIQFEEAPPKAKKKAKRGRKKKEVKPETPAET